MVYLSKPILFIILVVVLFVGGSSELIIEGLQDQDQDDETETAVRGCKPGCSAASSGNSGNCKWLPEKVPRSKQRYICPHTCKTPGTSGSGNCEYDTDCTKCTPQKDFTASAYADMQIAKGTGRACAKGNQCTFPTNGGLNVCNSVGVSSNDNSDSNGANNLICVKNEVAGTSVWTDISAAVLAIPYTPSQTALLSCDANRACATEGDSCVDATGGRIFCHNNLWLNDPKYDKTTGTRRTHSHGGGGGGSGGGSGTSSGGGGGTGANDDADDDDDDAGDGKRGKGIINDNYYTVNHFYGPSKRENRGILKPVAGAINKVANTAGTVVGGVAGGIRGAYDNIKNAFAPPLPKQMNYGSGGGVGASRYASGTAIGNTVVPLIVPKGEVATVQSYEASIRF